jgi:hypothetical protein
LYRYAAVQDGTVWRRFRDFVALADRLAVGLYKLNALDP